MAGTGKQGWAEFFSPPRRFKNLVGPKQSHPTAKNYAFALFLHLDRQRLGDPPKVSERYFLISRYIMI